VEKDTILDAILHELSGSYKLTKHLGGGEYSNVYLMKYTPTGEDRALKILDYHYLLQRLKKQNLSDVKPKFNEIKRRFISEARLYEKINHPSIVEIYDTGVLADPIEDIEIPYFIMSYIRGENLAEFIKHNAPIDISQAIDISNNVLEALEAMHSCNIIHRDIKASNIMIREATGEAVIIDFGIAKDIVGGTKLTTTGALLGSPAYMAPEQFLDSSNVGPALDIYSFGVVLFEMLTGDTPFKGGNFIEVMNAHRSQPVPSVCAKNPVLPPGTDLILATAMAKAPTHRYKSALEFREALREIHVIKKIPRSVKRRLPLWAVYASILICILIGATLIFQPFSGDSGKRVGKEFAPDIKIAKTQGHPITTPPLPPDKKNSQVDPLSESQPGPVRLAEMQKTYAELGLFLASQAQDIEKQKRCRQFRYSYRDMEKDPMGKEILKNLAKTMETLDTTIRTQQEFRVAIDAAALQINANDYEAASLQLKKASALMGPENEEIKQLAQTLEQKRRDFEKQNGKTIYQNIKDTVTLNAYLDFKRNYPDSIYLNQLKEQLTRTERRLPPEKYWDGAIVKNKKGYYEYTFGEDRNFHHMMYIPEKNFWIDKYEVSNAQYRRFLKALNISRPTKKNSKFIRNEDEFPVVVWYAEAEKYNKQYGFRLPRLEEWEYVAGKGDTTYPWGEELPDAGGIWRANFDSLEESVEKDGYSGTAPVKSFEAFASPFNVVNMAGNVWEWVKGNILKGGSFFSSKEDLKISKNRLGRDEDEEGFRCIKEENPGS